MNEIRQISDTERERRKRTEKAVQELNDLAKGIDEKDKKTE